MARIVNGVIVNESQESSEHSSPLTACNQQMEPWMMWVLLGVIFFLFGLKGLLLCGVGYGVYYFVLKNPQVSAF